MEKFLRSLLIILLVVSQSVYASLWGSGAYYGNAHCPYDEDDGDRYDAEYYIENDETLEGYRDQIADAKKRLRNAKNKMKEYRNKSREQEKRITKVLTDEAFEEGVKFHFEQKACPEDYRKDSCETAAPDAANVVPDTPGTPTSSYSPANRLDYALTPFRFLGLGFPKPSPLVIDEVPERAPVQNIAKSSSKLNRAPAETQPEVAVATPEDQTGGDAETDADSSSSRRKRKVTDQAAQDADVKVTARYQAIVTEEVPPDCEEGFFRPGGTGPCQAYEEVATTRQPEVRESTSYSYIVSGGDSALRIPRPFCQPHMVGSGNEQLHKQNFNYWNELAQHFKGGVSVGGIHAQCSGKMLPTVCDIHTRARQIIEPDAGEVGSTERRRCKKALDRWYKHYDKYLEAAQEVQEIEDELEEYEEWLEDGIDEIEYQVTEGEVPCLSGDCPKDGSKKKRNGLWKGIAAIAGGALLTGYLGKRATDQSTRAGFPAPPLTYAAMGWPFIQAGLNGLMGGSWGCSDTIYNQGGAGSPFGPYGLMTGGLYPQVGGVFGYPGGMFGNPMSAGMYMPGMSPYGMPGPWGGYMPFPSGFPGASGVGLNLGLNGPFGPVSNFYPYNVAGMGPFPQTSGWASPFFPQASMIPGFNGVGGFNPVAGYAGNPFGTAFNPYGNQFGNPYGSPFGNQFGSPFGNQFNPLGNYGQTAWNPYGNPYGTQLGGPLSNGIQPQIQQQYLAAQQSMLALSAQQMQRESQRAAQLNVLYQDYARLTAQIQALNSGSIYTGGIPFGGVTGGIFGGVGAGISGGISVPGLSVGGSIFGGVNSGYFNGTSFPSGGPFRTTTSGGVGAGRPPSSGTPR